MVFTSNVFAILGLRSMYFVIAGYLAGLKYLKPGLAAVLMFVGAKMILADVYKIPPIASLGVIIVILGIAIVASMRGRAEAEATQLLATGEAHPPVLGHDRQTGSAVS